MPLLVLRAGVTFETLINGVPALLDAATGFPVGVRFDVTGATVLDLAAPGEGPGLWAVTFAPDLPDGVIASDEFAVGDDFRIMVDGGIDLNIPFVTTLAFDGSAMLDVVLPGPGLDDDVCIDFTIHMALSETSVGNMGLAVGKLHLTADLDLVDDEGGITFPHVELWGAALLTTNFEFLQRFGLFASASGVLCINSTSSAKPDEELFDTANNPINVTLPAQSFAVCLDGSVDFRIDFNANSTFEASEQVFLLEGIFVIEFSAEQGFNVSIFRDDNGTVGPATLRLGPASSPFLQFDVLGFEDLDPEANPDDLMGATLDTGERYLLCNSGSGQSHDSSTNLVAMNLTPDEATAEDDTNSNDDIAVVIPKEGPQSGRPKDLLTQWVILRVDPVVVRAREVANKETCRRYRSFLKRKTTCPY